MSGLPRDWALARLPDERVARICFGVTIYLADARAWGRGGAAEALRRLLQHVPLDALRWATTSALPVWKRIGAKEGLAPWLDALEQRTLERPRHLLWFRAADETDAPSCAFTYREVDERRTTRSGFLQVLVPPTVPSTDFRRLVLALLDCGPYWSAVAGYTVSWNPQFKAAAFWGAHRWCRRYLALDVQDPDAMAWEARKGVLGTGWLTALGDPLLDALSVERTALLERSWKERIFVQPLERGLVVQAGAAPDLGDLNTLRYPAAHAEVARALALWVPPELPPLWGGFYEAGQSTAWRRRFVDPEAWTD